jgi:ATP synthase protein I
VLAELLGGVAGGALLGWINDRFAGTGPRGLLIVIALGIVAALVNIIRISNRKPDGS